MEYVHYYQTQSEFNADYNGQNYKEPWVGYVEETSGTSYNKDRHVTVKLFVREGQGMNPNDNPVTQSIWQSIVTGTPVETLEFNSPEELYNYRFLRTSPFPIMYLYFGSAEINPVSGNYRKFKNDLTQGNDVSFSTESGQYIKLSETHEFDYWYRPIFDEYFNEHREINVIYASYEYGG